MFFFDLFIPRNFTGFIRGGKIKLILVLGIDGLSVRNIMGQEVMNISTSGQTLVRLSMETLTSGAYILEYSYKGSVLGVQKIMKD